MSSIKVKYRPSSVNDRLGTVYYQIIHDRKTRQLTTEYRILPEEWDEHHSMVVAKLSSERQSQILSIRKRIRLDIERLTKITKKLDSKEMAYTTDDIIDEFKRYVNEYSIFNYMEGLIIKFKQNGKIRTSETYTAARNSFKRFLRHAKLQDLLCKGSDLMLDCITSEVMEAYEAWCKSNGNTPNTISFYTRILRAVYNRAVEDEITENKNPFKRVYTGVDKTVKRAISLEAIRKIKNLDLSPSPRLDFARDMFLMSFYLRGISFIDLAYLKKSDLKNGHISYRRRKTNQLLNIEWVPEMQMLLDKYDENPTEYLMPIITRSNVNQRNTYRNVGYNINRNLKTIAAMIGINIPLTMYVARHSWASAAKAKGFPLSVISKGMGHDNEATTQIYLESLETSVVDKANQLILSSL